MNPFTRRQVLAFGTACLLSAVAWYLCWPGRDDHAATNPPPAAATTAPAAAHSTNWNEVLAEVARARTNDERMAAAAKLGEVPVAEIPALLDSIELVKDRELTLAAKTLLIRWASVDGKAAAEWSWFKFRADGMWYFVIRDLAGAWAWHDPEGLAKWATDLVAQQGPGFHDSPPLAEVLKRDTPYLERNQTMEICERLLRESPRLAFGLYLKLPGWSTGDTFMWSALKTPQQISEALQAFPNIDGMNLNARRGLEGHAIYVHSLLTDWRKMDAAGFASSPYAKYLPVEFPEEKSSGYQSWKGLPAEARREAAAKLLETGSTEERAGLVSSMTLDWVKEDPAACGEWLDSLPPEFTTGALRLFAEGAGASQVETVWAKSGSLPAALREACRCESHAAWREAHAAGLPDMSGWSAEAQQAWSDLDALWQAGRR